MELLLVEYLPQVLVNIVVEYARIKPIRFRAIKEDQEEFSITEDGTRISRVTNDGRIGYLGFVGEEPFYLSHKTWTVDLSQVPMGFWIGIARVPSSGSTNRCDVSLERCCCISDSGIMLCWGKQNKQILPNGTNTNTSITFTADLETRTISTVVYDQEILWNVGRLEDCRPYICLDMFYLHSSIFVRSQ